LPSQIFQLFFKWFKKDCEYPKPPKDGKVTILDGLSLEKLSEGTTEYTLETYQSFVDFANDTSLNKFFCSYHFSGGTPLVMSMFLGYCFDADDYRSRKQFVLWPHAQPPCNNRPIEVPKLTKSERDPHLFDFFFRRYNIKEDKNDDSASLQPIHTAVYTVTLEPIEESHSAKFKETTDRGLHSSLTMMMTKYADSKHLYTKKKASVVGNNIPRMTRSDDLIRLFEVLTVSSLFCQLLDFGSLVCSNHVLFPELQFQHLL